MANEVDFDALVQKTMRADVTIEDLDTLYRHAFALPQWHFIARGEFPNVNPYVAANAEYADGQYMIRAFTDTERLQRFVKENTLEDADGSHLLLDVPTDKVVDYLEQFIAHGVHGIWFNSDTVSYGFFVPLQQLRPIKARLESIYGQKPRDA